MNEPEDPQKRAYTVVKPFMVKTVSGVKELECGASLNLTQEKAAGLQLQGFISTAASAGMLLEWRTVSGRIINLSRTPAAVATVPPGRAFFLSDELGVMRGLDRHTAELLIDIKEVFPGCIVVNSDVPATL